MPSIDGSEIFGVAVKMRVRMNPAVYHKAEFFGIDGVFSTFGGKRGRMIEVEGVLVGEDIATLNVAEGLFETYVDGRTHTLIDTRGREWPNVIYEGDFQPDPDGPKPLIGGGGWGLKYKAAFLALT